MAVTQKVTSWKSQDLSTLYNMPMEVNVNSDNQNEVHDESTKYGGTRCQDAM